MMRIVPATPELLERTRVGKPPMSMRALVGLDEHDNVVAVAGMYPAGHRMVLFADLTDQLRGNKRDLIRGIRALMELAAKRNAPVHALADPEIEGSRALLEHMGFKNLTGDLYAWHS